jgi:hypothetical protein
MSKYAFVGILNVLLAMFVAVPLYAGQSDSNGVSASTGEVTDSFCAKNGSHDQMMQDMKSMGHDKTSCSTQCVRLGAKYVLVDSSKQAIYQLDDQNKAAEFAGQKVRISGTLQKTKIKITDIQRVN